MDYNYYEHYYEPYVQRNYYIENRNCIECDSDKLVTDEIGQICTKCGIVQDSKRYYEYDDDNNEEYCEECYMADSIMKSTYGYFIQKYCKECTERLTKEHLKKYNIPKEIIECILVKYLKLQKRIVYEDYIFCHKNINFTNDQMIICDKLNEKLEYIYYDYE